MSEHVLSLFEGFGIEIESAIVDVETFDVRSVADELLRRATGGKSWAMDHDDGPIGWSNELVTHVLELKTNGPVASLSGTAADFRDSVRRMDAMLREGWNARVMPTGMHPWMDPRRETRIWPHEYAEVYGAYHTLFDCHRHGWANVQSVHLNLPFADESEFARLMAASRLVLPLIPALAASSPIEQGKPSGFLDRRLIHYFTNSARVPAMTGSVVPEPIFEIARYHEEVLGPIDAQLAKLPEAKVLSGAEWANARGVIARFDRMALEIRLIDAQESNFADLAVAAAVAGVVRGLVEERGSSFDEQATWSTEALFELLRATTKKGPSTPLTDPAYGRLFGFDGQSDATFGDLWRAIAARDFAGPAELEQPLAHILSQGTLAERILVATGDTPSRERLRAVYGKLADHLLEGTSFTP